MKVDGSFGFPKDAPEIIDGRALAAPVERPLACPENDAASERFKPGRAELGGIGN